MILPLWTCRPTASSKVQTFRGAKQSLALSKSLSESLDRLSQQSGANAFHDALAALRFSYIVYTGQDEFAVGVPIAGRNRTEIEPLIGFFVTRWVLRTERQAIHVRNC